MDLFDYMRENNMEKEAPLAARLRPRWSLMGSSRGPKRVRARKLAKKTVVSSPRAGSATEKGGCEIFSEPGFILTTRGKICIRPSGVKGSSDTCIES